MYPIENLVKIDPKSFRFSAKTIVIDTEIPAGFVTDGASVPRLFWVALSPFHDMFPAAIVHDFRCMSAVNHKSRRNADKEFYRNLKAAGLPFYKRFSAYLAVRGWSIFRMTFCKVPYLKKFEGEK